MVCVSASSVRICLPFDSLPQGFKHVFTSPSSVDKEPKATRSGNARIHGMISVTLASIAYIATQVRFPSRPLMQLQLIIHQVRFALSSSPVFTRTDTATDSENFYLTILDLLENPDEAEEVSELLKWWNRYVFLITEAEIVVDDITTSRSLVRYSLRTRRHVSFLPKTPVSYQESETKERRFLHPRPLVVPWRPSPIMQAPAGIRAVADHPLHLHHSQCTY